MPEAKTPPAQIDLMSVVVDFCRRFEPCSEAEADEIFTVGRLRDEFSAWLPPGIEAPDPMRGYLLTLEENGFHVHHTFSSGPAITVKYKKE